MSPEKPRKPAVFDSNPHSKPDFHTGASKNAAGYLRASMPAASTSKFAAKKQLLRRDCFLLRVSAKKPIGGNDYETAEAQVERAPSGGRSHERIEVQNHSLELG